ncbi:hypothetical protein C1645_826402 [Glomus cerebriforme]|uniref:Uncharacterized protein n=1 Tax=Glomus cerebriforme TaxID=658196 RepID=A0A397T017_9GLOM|nr:hypothetical protein C1645_826402 [Glomus cerebriforme]
MSKDLYRIIILQTCADLQTKKFADDIAAEAADSCNIILLEVARAYDFVFKQLGNCDVDIIGAAGSIEDKACDNIEAAGSEEKAAGSGEGKACDNINLVGGGEDETCNSVPSKDHDTISIAEDDTFFNVTEEDCIYDTSDSLKLLIFAIHLLISLYYDKSLIKFQLKYVGKVKHAHVNQK